MVSHRFARMAFCLLVVWVSVIWDLRVVAQTATAVCKPGYEWMSNSLGQSPCLMASYLGAGCSDPSIYNIAPTFSNYYQTKASATDCTCNPVAYSVFSACVLCQTELPTYLSWSLWIKNCTRTYVEGYPKSIPNGTAIPEWAFHDNVAVIGTFNATIAQSAAEQDPTEVTPSLAPSSPSSVLPSSTLLSTLTSVTPTINPGPSPQGGNSSGQTQTHIGALVGGIVGGVALLLAIIGVIAKWVRRRRATEQALPTSTTNLNANVQPEPEASPHTPDMQQTGSLLPLSAGEVTPSVSEQPIASSSRLYGPEDPSSSTFPDHYVVQHQQPSDYSGHPEV